MSQKCLASIEPESKGKIAVIQAVLVVLLNIQAVVASAETINIKLNNSGKIQTVFLSLPNINICAQV